MAVIRIVSNIAVESPEAARNFYVELLGLEVVMDHGWIATLAGETRAAPQLSVAYEGGSGTPVPDLSIEVDDLDVVLNAARRMELPIVYGPVTESWGVRRFYVRDPFGKLLNILSHAE
ncbi:VOC family protein [Aurantimonas marina]|uniref:VOC family protein n=1 Tax=Aurantimonas marina TaxID=2780508 RepID=UPI0019D2CF7C|nr:VOC family protein [Aurantimonas marina]